MNSVMMAIPIVKMDVILSVSLKSVVMGSNKRGLVKHVTTETVLILMTVPIHVRNQDVAITFFKQT